MTTNLRFEARLSRARGARPVRGVSVIDSMIAVAILGVAASLGAAGFGSLQAGAQATDTVNALQTTLQFARSEAVKRNTTVNVCASSDGATCSADWTTARQLLVFRQTTDPNGDPRLELLRAPVELSGRIEVITAPFETVLSYRPAGNLEGLSAAALNEGAAQWTIRVGERRTACVELLPSGHTRVVQRGDPRPCAVPGNRA